MARLNAGMTDSGEAKHLYWHVTNLPELDLGVTQGIVIIIL